MSSQIHVPMAGNSRSVENADVSDRLHQHLRHLLNGQNLTKQEAAELLGLMLAQGVTDAQIAAVLASLAAKGETSEELAGMAEGMRQRMLHLQSSTEPVIDTAGTGASRAKTFNVSTAAAFVIAAAGLPIAKHGARAATSRSGSADLLTALGVKIDTSRDTAERCLRELGICFLFAPLYHPAAARVASVRRELGIRTVFNLIGPLCNPAGAVYQVLGVGDRALQAAMAEALASLGCKRAWVVHGCDGLDEVTIAGDTYVMEVEEGKVRERTVSPEEFGIERGICGNLRGVSAAENAATVLSVLDGSADRIATDLVVLNAAAALYVAKNMDLHQAAEAARMAIVSGEAMRRLDGLRAMTNGNGEVTQ